MGIAMTKIYELKNTNEKGSELEVKSTTIVDEGKVLDAIHGKIVEIQAKRFDNLKKEANVIAMSPVLFQYLTYIAKKNTNYYYSSALEARNSIKLLFGLKVVVRDDYEFDEIDVYRDVTEEY